MKRLNNWLHGLREEDVKTWCKRTFHKIFDQFRTPREPKDGMRFW